MSIDTSKMSKEKAASLEAAEAGRDEVSQKSFAAGLFVGEMNLDKVMPFPEQSEDQHIKGKKFHSSRLTERFRDAKLPDYEIIKIKKSEKKGTFISEELFTDSHYIERY